jgi:hypothetical protein
MKQNTIEIKQIDWLDKDNPEAEILFELEGKQFWAFCHPCDFEEGETIQVYFSFIEDEVSEPEFWKQNKENKKEIIQSKDNRSKYYCYGQLKRIHPVIIDCGVLTLSFGDWINDEKTIGNYVYFVMARFDIIRI